MQIFDNLFTIKEQEKIKDVLYGINFPWYYVKDVTFIKNKSQTRPALTHNYMVDGGIINSDFYNDVKIIYEKVNKKIKQKLKPFKVRSFLQFPLNETFLKSSSKSNHMEDTPHLDLKIEHLVYLYYVNDCDGDTITYHYNTKRRNNNETPYYEDMKIEKKITPKQGRVVVFDGMTWHSSTQPTKGPRCIVNFDMV